MKTLEEYMALPYRLEIIPDPDEGGFVGTYPDLPGCLTSGDTMEAVAHNAEDAKRAWLTAALQDGLAIREPESPCAYSGQFKLRIPKSLHRSLAEHSRSEGISMNQYCLYLLAKNDAQYGAYRSPTSTPSNSPHSKTPASSDYSRSGAGVRFVVYSGGSGSGQLSSASETGISHSSSGSFLSASSRAVARIYGRARCANA